MKISIFLCKLWRIYSNENQFRNVSVTATIVNKNPAMMTIYFWAEHKKKERTKITVVISGVFFFLFFSPLCLILSFRASLHRRWSTFSVFGERKRKQTLIYVELNQMWAVIFSLSVRLLYFQLNSEWARFSFRLNEHIEDERGEIQT